MTTQYSTDPLADVFVELVLALVGPGVAPRIVETIAPDQCEFCGEAGAVTTVRVYGQPAPDCPDLHPVDVAEVCGLCAPAVIARAQSEKSDTAGDLVIEVAA